jgi:DNA-binding MurR/RpiR family transcriptional regulator
MSSKKENLIDLLTELSETWETARGLLILVESSEDDENPMIESLLSIISNAIESTTDEIERSRLKNISRVLSDLQSIEIIEKESSHTQAIQILQYIL